MENRHLGVLGLSILAVGIVAAIAFTIVVVVLPHTGITATSNSTPTDAYGSAGERIYNTGLGHNGAISRSGGWGMMGSGGCVNCHGADGRGGTIGMMGRFTVPAITYGSLTSEHLDDRGETEDAWTEDDIVRAIRTGDEPDGETLSRFMPRWDIDDTDMTDLIAYLKQLD